ncbi:MAG: Fe-S cluster assembly protein SufD [Gammaproteobacteria bacterium]|jgi:Fe-S cluster assembly protein SufD|nr:Fe-S cluster assembly protein SufD [Chromatiales bacterium]MDP7660943.1 Fe-S cluster assembly protein SufD [Gammaproteobacteria bacterium]
MNTATPDTATIEVIRKTWQERPPAANPYLHGRMTRALEAFAGKGFPTTRLENWKYTDVRKLAASYPEWLRTAPDETATPDLEPLVGPDSVRISFVDGIYRPDLSTAGDLPPGIFAGSVSELLSVEPALEDKLGKLAQDSDSAFVALNTAFAGDALAIVLPDNVELQKPIYVRFHSSTSQLGTQPRVMVELGARSRATLIEHYTSGHEAIVNSVTEIRCLENAALNYYKVQDEHTDSWHTAAQYVELARNAKLTSMHLDTGAGLARNELHVRLAGPAANADCKGLFMGSNNQHIESRINIEHAAPETQSRERFRGILADKARGVFNGRIYVEPQAQKTAAELTNRNLLLSKGAEIDTKPELEIYADDVKCAHGSSTGQLDENSLFYLMSRGIEHDEARSILVEAFAGELLGDTGIEAIARKAQQSLRALRKVEQ